MNLTLNEVSSLEKIRSASDLSSPLKKVTLLGGEHFAYQIAVIGTSYDFKISVDSALEKYITLYAVKNVNMDRPCYIGSQDTDRFLSSKPGLMPDLLEPIENTGFIFKHYEGVSALWVDINLPNGFAAGSYPVKIEFRPMALAGHSSPDMPVYSCITADVLPFDVPESDITFTQWFHTDSIASYYNVPVYSEKHWELIDKFMAMASYFDINMILTPVITPPLDTLPGSRRPLTQLVKITKDGNKYSFDFSLLGRWISLCRKNNIPNLEISHLFSQWGAEFAPNIFVNDAYLFGWDVKASDTSYKEFLEQFLPALRDYLKSENMYENSYFHLSDEPNETHMEAYLYAKNLVKSILPECRIMDALSHVDYYDRGLTDIPVPGLDSVDAFLERNIENPWVYYCCGAAGRSNRYIAMPSARTRILGLQMYKYGIKGFLHWGYNFYYSGLSMYDVNPYVSTSADKHFPSGDAFSVYPGTNGPLPSLRGVVFKDGLEDITVCRLVEEKIGKQAVLDIIDSELGYELTLDAYPVAPETIPRIMEKLKSVLK